MIDKLVIEVVSVEGVGGEVVLVQEVLFYSFEVLCEVTEIVGLEVVGISLEIDCFEIGSGGASRLFVVGKRIKYFLR